VARALSPAAPGLFPALARVVKRPRRGSSHTGGRRVSGKYLPIDPDSLNAEAGRLRLEKFPLVSKDMHLAKYGIKIIW
jgi:hypothetical protein